MMINIVALKQGNPKQIKTMVDCYSDTIYHLCISYVFNRQDAEELTQDVFFSCVQSIGSFKGNCSIKTWLVRIAIYKCLDFIKYRKRNKRSGTLIPITNYGEEDYGIEPVNAIHPGIILETEEQMDALYHGLNRLPERQRTALTLMKLDGNSQ